MAGTKDEFIMMSEADKDIQKQLLQVIDGKGGSAGYSILRFIHAVTGFCIVFL